MEGGFGCHLLRSIYSPVAEHSPASIFVRNNLAVGVTGIISTVCSSREIAVVTRSFYPVTDLAVVLITAVVLFAVVTLSVILIVYDCGRNARRQRQRKLNSFP